MSELSLRNCENEVEMARAKLARDLAVLRSPTTVAAFTNDLKRGAFETKDAVLETVRSTAQTTAERLVEDLKAKAAANPAATLAIGAGIAWRLFRSPPIATMLVGAGLFSLWRTQARSTVPGEQRDYFNEGKERLIAQAGELADAARQKAVETGETVADKAAALMSATGERLEQWSATAGATAQEMASAVQARAAEGIDAASRRLQAGADAASQRLTAAADQAASLRADVADVVATSTRTLAERASAASEHIPEGPELKDIVLRGAANVALVAAIGLICKKRFTEHAEP